MWDAQQPPRAADSRPPTASTRPRMTVPEACGVEPGRQANGRLPALMVSVHTQGLPEGAGLLP